MSSRGTVGIKDRSRVLELPSGNDVASGGAERAPAGRARLRVNMVTKQVEASVDGSDYGPFASGQGGVTQLEPLSDSIPLSPGMIAVTAPSVSGPAPKVIWFTALMDIDTDRLVITLRRDGSNLESYNLNMGAVETTFSAHWTDVDPAEGENLYSVRVTSLDGVGSTVSNRRITIKDL